jgi:hypothetical protein
MHSNFNLADVPVVNASDLGFAIQLLVGSGRGLAFLRGMHENEIREIEDRIWSEYQGSSEARLAVALRFRALLDVFASRRLKELFLDRGLRLLSAAAQEAATTPLNVRFGFKSQRLLLALDAASLPVPRAVEAEVPMPMAA